MKISIVFALVLVLGVSTVRSQNLDERLEKLRADARARLAEVLRDPRTFLKSIGRDVTKMSALAAMELVNKVIKAANTALQMMLNPDLSFAAFPDMSIFWTEAEQALRRGIFFNSNRTDADIKDTKYNYTYINWAHLGKVSPVKDQGKCGSCYAFGSIAGVESQYLIHDNVNVSLSEQQIVDCSYMKYPKDKPIQNQGCKQGTTPFTLDYVNEFDMLTTSQYPYVQAQGTCKPEANSPKRRNYYYATVRVENEDHLAFLLNVHGPVTIYIYAGSSFGYYAGGVFNDPFGAKGQVNHAVLLVGIEMVNGKENWIIKNSWGSKFGEGGYIRWPKGRNMCSMITNDVIIHSLDKPVTL